MSTPKKNLLVSTLALLFLAGAAVDRKRSMVAPDDTAEYQARVRETEAQLPYRIGDWVGETLPVPQAAIAILHPNVITSRRYVNIVTGHSAEFLLVQCSDARDMAGHYPPICYPNQGWILDSKDRKYADIGDLKFHYMEYRFLRSPNDPSGVVVRNFMVLPDGRIEPGMDEVRKSTSINRRFYGAGQAQIRTSTGLSAQERDEVFYSLVLGHESLISAILAGTRRESF